MTRIPVKQFITNVDEYFVRVDNGERIIICSNQDKYYELSPKDDDEVYFNENLVKRIKRSYQQAKEGNTTTITSHQGIKKILGL